ncbi:uncharacterized protein METZ01_LOCUS64627 [marine metagenome]|uniref:Uncharacterized protein n=1 Tax=marine metagenome TaxID=408172 RepID=A0A381TCX8_9ZZZZ
MHPVADPEAEQPVRPPERRLPQPTSTPS